MFDKLKRFFQGEPSPVAEKVDDPVLGTLTWSKDDEAWVSGADHADVGFVFMISGTPEPDKALLAHAAELLRRKDEFVAEVLAYVKSEGERVRHFSSYSEEIAGLSVEQVNLCWPERPDDGMISLSGGRDYRLWRCDYVARKPKGLGFDS
jgi:hypothetical protein